MSPTTATHAPATVLPPGTTVRWIPGEDEPEDTGVIYATTEGGYAVIWVGDFTPHFVPAEEVEPIDPDRQPLTYTRS